VSDLSGDDLSFLISSSRVQSFRVGEIQRMDHE